MKNTVKHIISIFCILALILCSFAGCKNNDPEYSIYSVVEEIEVGGENTDTESTGDSTGNVSATQSAATQSGTQASTDTSKVNPADYKGTTVVYATWERSEGFDSDKVKQAFKKKYGITLQYKSVAQTGYLQSILAMINSGNAPDVIKDCDFWPGFIQIAQPLENAKIDLTLGLWDQEHLKQSEVNGKHYSLASTSLGQNITICYYNKKLLQNNGIRTPEEYQKIGKWNFDAFEQIMKETKQKLPTGYYGAYLELVGNTLWGCYNTEIIEYSNGKFSNGTGGKNFAGIAKKIAEWSKAGYIVSGREQFAEGKVALAISSDYGLRKTGHWRNANWNDIGYIDVPSYEGQTPAISGTWQGYGICKKAKNPIAGGIFLTWYLNENNHDITSYYISEDAYTFRAQRASKLENKYLTHYASVFGSVGLDYNEYNKGVRSTDPTQIDQYIATKKNTIDSNVAKIQKFYDDIVKAELKAY